MSTLRGIPGGIAILALLTSGATVANPRTSAVTIDVRAGAAMPGIRNLPAGTRRYVRYQVGSDGRRKLVDIWQRTTSFEPQPGSGAAGLHVVQRWDGVDGRLLEQDSWFDALTFAPITHVRRETRAGVTKVSAYRFSPTAVTGDPGVPGNDHAEFRMALDEPVLNFEFDMETLEALPLAVGTTFTIPFYDAGIDPKPGRYPFEVAGSATIAGWDGRPVDCWLVTATYGTGKILNRFWISKRGHALVREEAPLKDGGTLVKALLPPE